MENGQVLPVPGVEDVVRQITANLTRNFRGTYILHIFKIISKLLTHRHRYIYIFTIASFMYKQSHIYNNYEYCRPH